MNGLEFVFAFPWMGCLFQVSMLLLLAYATNRCLLRRYPGIASTVGLVAMTASAGLIVLTLMGVPRPFEFVVVSTEPVPVMEMQSNSVLAESTAHGSFFELMPSAFKFFSERGATPDKPLMQSWEMPRMSTCVSVFVVISLAFSILRAVHGTILIRRLVRRSAMLVDSVTDAMLAQLTCEVECRLRQTYKVRAFSGQGSPFVSWVTGRTIYVPERFADWTDDEKHVSLGHEIAHLQRQDDVGRMLLDLTRWALWFHPFAWLLSRQTEFAQEMAADHLAATKSKSSHFYCRALSRLALRFDAECRSTPSLGVSISSSLIRRITMLEKFQFHRHPRTAISRGVSMLAIAISGLIGCWSVAAQTQESELRQDASPVVLASHNEPAKPFSQPISQPWKDLGPQPGYLSVNVSRLIAHPEIKPMVTGFTDYFHSEMLQGSKSASEFGLQLEKINRIEGSLNFSYDYSPTANEGDRSSIQLAGSAVKIVSDTEVDWPGLINAIDFSSLIGDGSTVTVDEFKKAILAANTKGQSFIFRSQKRFGGKETAGKVAPDKKKLWNAIAGGDVAWMYDVAVPQKAMENATPTTSFEKANLDLMVDVQAIGVGIEFSPEFKTSVLRVAIAPKAGVKLDQVLQKTKAWHAVMVSAAEAEADAEAESSEEMERYVEQLESLKISVVAPRKIGDHGVNAGLGLVIAEGHCEIPLATLFNRRTRESQGAVEANH